MKAAAGHEFIYGPTFGEMLDPRVAPAGARARAARMAADDRPDPVGLFDITWRDQEGRIRFLVLDQALTGVEANILLLEGAALPTGSHKVGAAYSVAVERQLEGDIVPGRHTLIWPSTGNYGIGGAWVGPRLGYRSVVFLPERVSRERFERIAAYGARCIRTPGGENRVKEIYDACAELYKTDPESRVLNQFEAMANYRFHYYVTGNSVAEAVGSSGLGNGRVAVFVAGVGSGGTLAAGDRLKQVFPECRVVALEPIQCPTLFANGYGNHDIQGIGDGHVTWIHNTMNTDAVMCVDDVACKKGLQLLTDPRGAEYLAGEAGVDARLVERLRSVVGISGVGNILGAIKAVKFYGLGPKDNVVTVATDGADRYASVMADTASRHGPIDRARAAAYLESIFHGAGLDWIQEGDRASRARWHNLKYFSWVEQHGKPVAELRAQASQEWWIRHQEAVADLDRRLLEARGY